MQVKKSAKEFCDANFNKMKFGRTFHRNETKNGRYLGIDNNLKGIYFMYMHGADPITSTPLYIGQTFKCIKGRILNHRRSLLDPTWKVELTGSKFVNAGLDLDQKIDVYYILAEDIGITCKIRALSAETSFIIILNPLAYGKQL
jgi:hypothetical protein